MPTVATQAIMPSSDVTPEYAEAMNEAIDATSRAESERDDARAELARLREALGMVSLAAANACTGKAYDLYWLGRRDIETARHGPGGPAIERIMANHAAEAEKIANGDQWEHGYWAGTLAFARLIQGLAQVEDHVCEDDPDADPIPVATLRAQALAEYPVLDS
jgi:hypothetical protein